MIDRDLADEPGSEHRPEHGERREKPAPGIFLPGKRGGREQFLDPPVAVDQQRHAAGHCREEGEHDGEDHDIDKGEVESAIDGELRPAGVGRAGRDLHAAGHEPEREEGQDRVHEHRQRPLPKRFQLEPREGKEAIDHRAPPAAVAEAGTARASGPGISCGGQRMRTR